MRLRLQAGLALAVLVAGGCADAEIEPVVEYPNYDMVFYSDRSGRGDIYMIPAEGFRTGSFSAQKVVGTPAPDFNPRWVPAGPGLVFLTEVETPAALYALPPDAEGMSLRMGTNPALDEPPAFSPDGQTTVFAAVLEEGGMDLFVGDLQGGEPRRLTDDGGRKAQPSISPDGEWVVFGEGGDGAQNLGLMRLDGSERRALTDGPSNDGHPTWLPDGSGIVFDSNRVGVGTDIFHLDLESGAIRNVTNDPGVDLVPAVTPDGQWIAFGSSRSGNWDLYLAPFQGGAARQLTAVPTFEGDPQWLEPGVLSFPTAGG